MLPVLIILADAISLYGAWIGVNIGGTTSLSLFYSQVFDSLDFSDIILLSSKAFFGFAVGIVGAYKGYNAVKGTRGVGNAANSAVVLSSILIFVLDLIAVQITGILGYN
jgi:phospholipid/cholesterol/gamma-HCH transport system permease protein